MKIKTKQRQQANSTKFEQLEVRNLLASAVAGLVDHWNFDEGPSWQDDAFGSVSTATVAKDSVGTNNATLTNMTGSAFVSGQQFTAISLDGVNDYLATTSALSTTASSTATVSFWLKTSQVGTTSTATSPSIMGSSTSMQWGSIDNQGKIGVGIGSTMVAKSSVAINDNKWHFVMLTRDSASGAVQVYVDGILSGSGTGLTGAIIGTYSSIGRNEGTTPVYYQGRLDQLSLFNAVQNSTTETQLRTNYGPRTWPVTTDGVASTTFATASVFYSAFDAEKDTLRVSSFTQPSHGTIVDNGDGTFNYTPTGNYNGSDSFTAIVEDQKGGVCQNNG